MTLVCGVCVAVQLNEWRPAGAARTFCKTTASDTPTVQYGPFGPNVSSKTTRAVFLRDKTLINCEWKEAKRQTVSNDGHKNLAGWKEPYVRSRALRGRRIPWEQHEDVLEETSWCSCLPAALMSTRWGVHFPFDGLTQTQRAVCLFQVHVGLQTSSCCLSPHTRTRTHAHRN